MPLEGDKVDSEYVIRYWSTGKVELSDGRSVHAFQLAFVDHDWTTGIETYTVVRDYNPNLHS